VFIFGLVALQYRSAGPYFRCTSSHNDISLRETWLHRNGNLCGFLIQIGFVDFSNRQCSFFLAHYKLP